MKHESDIHSMAKREMLSTWKLSEVSNSRKLVLMKQKNVK